VEPSDYVGTAGEVFAETIKRSIENQKHKMTTITLVSKLIVDEQMEAILFDAMRSATKVFNGHIEIFATNMRKLEKRPSVAKISIKIKRLPCRKDYYSLSTQGTRDEVIGADADKSVIKLRKNGDETARPPGFRRKNNLSNLRYYDGYGFEIEGDKLILRFVEEAETMR